MCETFADLREHVRKVFVDQISKAPYEKLYKAVRDEVIAGLKPYELSGDVYSVNFFCDFANNPPHSADSNWLIGDLVVQPVRMSHRVLFKCILKPSDHDPYYEFTFEETLLT